MRLEPVERAAGAPFGGDGEPRAGEDEHRRDRPRQPWRPELAEHDMEREADADRGERGAHPAGEGPLHRHDGAILGEMGPLDGQLFAVLRLGHAV